MGAAKRRRRAVCLVLLGSAVLVLAMVLTTVFLLRDSTENTIAELADPDVVLPPCVPRGYLCSGLHCCNLTVEEVFSSQDFDAFFPNRNCPTCHAQEFYFYYNFIEAAKMFYRKGFGILGGEEMQKREIAAFLAHVAHESSCGYTGIGSLGGAYAYGLCWNVDPNLDSLHCTPDVSYPCVPGVSYHGRGAMRVYGNQEYGWIGEGLGLDLLHHPELLQNNATLAFASSLYKWMTERPGRPSSHNVMLGAWKPSQNDTLASRLPGFGLTINILAHKECGHGADTNMNDRVAHYNVFLGLLGNVPSGNNTECGNQGEWIPPQGSFL